MSNRTKELVQQLEPVCAKVSTVLKLMLLDLKKDPKMQAQEEEASGVRVDRSIVPPEDESDASENRYAEVAHGMQRNLEEALHKLLGVEVEDNLSVCSIFGLTGAGKTTLGQFLYNNSVVEDYWEIRIWIHASSNFDVHNLSCQIFNLVPVDHFEHLGITSNMEVNGSQYQKNSTPKFNPNGAEWQKVFHCCG